MRRSGFTMIELMVAMSIALVIFLAGFTVINGISNARSATMARVKASEDARLFFQKLEQEFATAFPAALNPAFDASIKDKLVLKDPIAVGSGSIENESMMFYSSLDLASAADTPAYVRYYVNDYDELCREWTADFASFPVDPAKHSEADAVFGNVYSLVVIPQVWDESAKKFTTASVAAQATHFQVWLTLYDSAGVPPSQIALRKSALPKHMFQRMIPIPASFKS